MDPHGWLDNFLPDERPFALNMLNVFLYYNEQLVDSLLAGAVQRLSTHVIQSPPSFLAARSTWRSFLQSVLVTYVQGETPSPTDSGYLFVRKARQVLGIHEQNILHPSSLLSRLSRNPEQPVLLLDDFVGSANQTIATWKRLYSVSSDTSISFASAAQSGTPVFYVPLIATTTGLARITSTCPQLCVYPAHTLDDSYNLLSSKSILWPEALRVDAPSVLFQASQRAGIVASYPYGWKGYHSLALPLAFYHSVPDATLPLFFWDQNGWFPLLARN